MNGGTDSTLPVRNQITRPVSFHSLSEHNRNNQAYLSPYAHRRPRAPRSSPLAGPSLSSENLDGENKNEEGGQKPRYRPNRISSTPDMAVRPHSLYNPDTSSAVSNGPVGILVSPPPTQHSSPSSSSDEDDKGKQEAGDGTRLRNFTKRLSMISTSSLTTNETDKESQKAKKRRSGFLVHSTSTSSLASSSSSRTARTDKTGQTAPPIPTIPRWALNAMREEAGIANRNMKYGHRRGTSHDLTGSLPPLPNQPIPRGGPLSAPGLSNQSSRTPSVSRDPTENWMSVTDPIPKFSRLGLKGEAVVLPVKKKESLAKMKSSGSIGGTKSTATVSQPTTTRRDSGGMTRNESNPGTGSDANRKEEGLRKRSSSLGSLKAKIPKISVSSSADSENVPPLPSSIIQSGSNPALVSNSRTSSDGHASKTPRTTPFPPMGDTPNTRGVSALRKDSVLAAIEEDHPPSPPPEDIETGTGTGNVGSQDAQKKRARRKSIKQIVMRITTAPMAVKFGGFHNAPSTPVVVLPPETLMPLDPPSTAFFRKRASASVQSLPATGDLARNRADALGGGRFKGFKKRWNAVFETVRR